MSAHEFSGLILAFAFGSCFGIFSTAIIYRHALARLVSDRLKIAELRCQRSILESEREAQP